MCVWVCRRDLRGTPWGKDCRPYSIEGLFATGSALKIVVIRNFSSVNYKHKCILFASCTFSFLLVHALLSLRTLMSKAFYKKLTIVCWHES